MVEQDLIITLATYLNSLFWAERPNEVQLHHVVFVVSSVWLA